MISIIRYTFITAIRDLLFIGMLATITIAIFIAKFLGNTALVEQDQMTIAYMAGSTRVILVVGLILFVCFHVRRSFDNKEIEVILTKPISRSQFVIAYWLAFAFLSMIITVCLAIMTAAINKINFVNLLCWSASLFLEGIIMIGFAMLSALILKSAVASSLSSLCFYFISRMMGFFIATIDHYPHGFSKNSILEWSSEQVLRFVSIMIPRLDLFGKTGWLIHESINRNEFMIIIYQSLIYIPLILAAVIFDFKRKEF